MTRSYIFLPTLLAAIVLAGCAKLTNQNNSQAPDRGGVIANSNRGESSPPPPAAVAAGTPTTWEEKASSLNGKDGQTFVLACSPNGAAHTVWGSDIYTSDSSICTAAVYGGLITLQQGGTVTLEIRPGRPIYGCGERNGVETSCYGSWAQSFVLNSRGSEAAVREAEDQTQVTWTFSPAMLNSEDNKPWKFKCPADGKESNVWGTDTYTADSSVCNAAVHAGKFSRDAGGAVTIEFRPGASSYKGTTRNGVTSNDYGQYGRSFVIK
ncbi:MAG TPA: LCCL domain-containing protein [Pyrinomonadaceae bacterium]|nr:LCCL domain-containing protein [Pyrinomonadaceae bacterium]